MPLAQTKSRQFPQHFSVLSTADKPTAGVPYGATLIESDTYLTNPEDAWYIFTAAGWVKETMPAIVATLGAALPAGDNNIGNVDIVTLPGTVETDIGTTQDDIALIKAQNQTFKPTLHSFAFDEDDLTKTSAITYNGLVKHLHIVVPNFTNVVTVTVTLVDAAGRVLWTSAAKAKNASYNLEAGAEWFDQAVDNTLVWTVTLSGVAGGAGGTVTLVPRYYGV